MNRYKIALETVIGKDFGPDGTMQTFEYKQGKITDLETFNEYEIMLEPMTAVMDFVKEQKTKLADYESLGTVDELTNIIENTGRIFGELKEYEAMFGPLNKAKELYSEESDYPKTFETPKVETVETPAEVKEETTEEVKEEPKEEKSAKKGLLG